MLTILSQEFSDTAEVYSRDRIRQTLAVMNLLWWTLNGGDVEVAKYCKLAQGFVQDDYQCDGCKMCESKPEDNNGSTR